MRVDSHLIQTHMGITDSRALKVYNDFPMVLDFVQPFEDVVMRFERFTPSETISVPFYKKGIPCLEFVYALSAEAFFSVSENGGARTDKVMRSGTSGALFNREISGICEINSSVPVQVLYVYITPEKFIALLGQDNRRVVEKLINKVNSKTKGFAATSPIQPAVEVIVHQIINRRFCEAADPLFLQAKIMELLAQEVEIFCGLPDRDCCLQPNDIARLQMAKNVMMKNMSEPPTLRELARLVGLNQKKIKQGFRELFDTTVFGFLRQYRMEQARLMFEKDLSSVSEVAGAVGYTNVSHFGAAFKSHHGVLPGEYKRSLKKKFLLNSSK